MSGADPIAHRVVVYGSADDVAVVVVEVPRPVAHLLAEALAS